LNLKASERYISTITELKNDAVSTSRYFLPYRAKHLRCSYS